MSADSTRRLSVNTSDGESVGGLPGKDKPPVIFLFINTQRWAALCHSVQSSIRTCWQGVTHMKLHKVWQMQICGSKKPIQSSMLWPSQQRQPSCVCVCVCDNYSWVCRTAWLTVCWDKLIFYPPLGFPLSFSATRVSQVFSCRLSQCHCKLTRLLFAAFGRKSLPLFSSLYIFMPGFTDKS